VAVSDAVAEVVATASELIAIDTTNPGDPDVPGREAPAAEYVAAKLAAVGYEPEYVRSGPGRGNVVVRLPGTEPGRGGLLVHGHLDVVPADAAQWAVHPFSGQVRDGYVWGRGAVDMKGMVAMTIAVARAYRRDGVRPRRDLVFAFLADEEAGGFLGARWLVDHRADLFEGVTEAISEVGGFSVTVGGRRAYLVQTAEKGVAWIRLAARGVAGHGSLLYPDHALGRLAAAVGRVQAHAFPVVLRDPVPELLAGLASLRGMPFDPAGPEAVLDGLGPVSRLLGASLRDTANATMFDAGYAPNVVPATARATVDGRFLPGREAAYHAEVLALLGPGIDVSWDSLPAVHTPFGGDLVDAIAAALAAEDPGAAVLPYLMPASTDAKSFARLGIRHLGFAPLRLPPDLDFTALFHGTDERVPTSALEFGTRVLHRLLRTA
jgi:acetylornithine deacetylase/succinyl-diaminopimelate desuccinylase-like protein